MTDPSQQFSRLSNSTLSLKEDSEAPELRHKPFWIWDSDEHEQRWKETLGDCCFWHIIGLPEKEHLIGRLPNGTEQLETKTHNLKKYQKEWLDALDHNRYLWIKKATGMAATTFFLAHMAWLCLRNDDWKGRSMGIVTGPRINIALDEIKRISQLFRKNTYRPRVVGASITLNGCRIEAYPSHTFDSARGLEKVQYWFVDEGDFFPAEQGHIARRVVERYEAKTHPIVVFNSTANLPNGLFQKMELEKESMYTRILSLYQKGLDEKEPIYTQFEINEAKKSLTFDAEYNGMYGVGRGNIFPFVDICVEQYDLKMSNGDKGLYADPAYGSSMFGLVGFEKLDGILYVKEATEYERPSPTAMVDIVKTKAQLYFDNYVKVDSAHPGFIKDLRLKNVAASEIVFGRKVIKGETDETNKMNQRQLMTIQSATTVKDRMVRIHPEFKELIAQLKAIRFDDKGGPEKKVLTFDLGDAFMMGCWDMREFDYRSIGITHDGKIIDEVLDIICNFPDFEFMLCKSSK